MKAASLLVLLLSNQGYWFGGQEGAITIRPAATGGLPAAVISWRLMLDSVQLQAGRMRLAADDSDTVIHITPPRVRVRTPLKWFYEVVPADGGKSLENGDRPVVVFPTDLMEHLAKRLRGIRLAIWDRPQSLPKFLDRWHVLYAPADSGKLEVSRADIVLIGEGRIDASPFTQVPLLDLARSGASVMIFRQTVPQHLMGYDLVERTTPARLEWRTDHPLLVNFEADDLASWIKETTQLLAVQLPADEPALEIGYYPREVSGNDPTPIAAVLVSKTVGKGRFVLCQIPLGDWNTDPRSQILLTNVIDYLLSPPQPTPRPSQRPLARSSASQPVRTIEIPPGAEP